jgi:transcription initiation factor TFIID subunit 10
MVDTVAADPNESSHNTLDSSDTVNPDVDNSGTTIDLNGDESQAPVETQDTQDVAMADQPGSSANPENALPESRIPAKKDATLREFLSKMDDHAPIVSSFILQRSRFL